MGNPHPTKSKPIKIGRKHTGAKSLRHKGRIASAAKQRHKIEAIRHRKFKAQVSAFWRGERENYPTH